MAVKQLLLSLESFSTPAAEMIFKVKSLQAV